MNKLYTPQWYYFSLLFLILSGNIAGQVFDSRPEAVWLRQDSATLDSLPTVYVGNHSILKKEVPETLSKLKFISQTNYGSLFIVLRPSVSGLSQEVLMRLGQIKLFRDHLQVNGKQLEIPAMDSAATILKVIYQFPPPRHPGRAKTYISPEVDIAEVIYYDHLLDDDKARKVESMLAMKYSINITENSDPNLRDYVSLYNTKAWHATADRLYSREVLALGRMDRVHFYQDQTCAWDGDRIRLGLQHEGLPGDTPVTAIGDGSLLVVSQREADGFSACGGDGLVRPWKFRFQNWQSEAPHLYLSLDTLIDSITNTVITDGSRRLPVQVSYPYGGERTTFQIPVPDSLQPDHPWFMEWEVDTPCPAMVRINPLPCAAATGHSSLTITVDTPALPVSVYLVNNDSGESLKVTQQQPEAVLSNLEAGLYQLVIRNGEGILQDRLIRFDDCRVESAPTYTEDAGDTAASSAGVLSLGNQNEKSGRSQTGWVFKETSAFGGREDVVSAGPQVEKGSDANGITGPGQPSMGIQAYPNPGSREEAVYFRFNRLSGIEFMVRVYDAGGTLLQEERFTPCPSNPVYEYRFKVDGSYLVQFLSPDFSMTKPVHIKSNR